MTNDLESRLIASSSFGKDAVKTTSYNDDYRVGGNCFFSDIRFNLAKSATVFYKLDVSSVAGTCFLLPLRLNCSKGPLLLDLYAGDNYEKGAVVPLVNANENSDKTAISTLNIATAPAVDPTKGTLKASFLIGLSGKPAALTGGSNIGSNPLILDTTKSYLIEITNIDTVNDAIVGMALTEFEI